MHDCVLKPGIPDIMMDELITAVARAASLPQEQAAIAVGAMLRFMTARLPSALVGELHARLRAVPDAAKPADVPHNDQNP